MRGRENMSDSPLGDIAYAFHFDAGLYARTLRRHDEARGKCRTEGEVVEVAMRQRNGGMAAVVLQGRERVAGDNTLVVRTS